MNKVRGYEIVQKAGTQSYFVYAIRRSVFSFRSTKHLLRVTGSYLEALAVVKEHVANRQATVWRLDKDGYIDY